MACASRAFIMRRSPRYLSLSLEAFQAASTGLRMEPGNVELARAVLVEGATAKAVAERAGISRQAVEKTCRRIYQAFIRSQNPPHGWRHVCLFAPPELAEDIERAVAKARVAADLEARSMVPSRRQKDEA